MIKRIAEAGFILLLSGTSILAANMLGYQGKFTESLIATLLVIAIGMIGFILSCLPIFNKIYMVLWVSVISIILSSPLFPGHEWIANIATKVNFMAIATPILAYAGLAIGKDLNLFKTISWKIIPVALAVCAGTFLFATLIAQLALEWEGII